MMHVNAKTINIQDGIYEKSIYDGNNDKFPLMDIQKNILFELLLFPDKRLYVEQIVVDLNDGFSMEDHIKAIEDHVHDKIDLVVYAEDRLPQEVLDRYVQLESVPVTIKNEFHDYIVIKTQLLEFGNGLIRHDSARIKEVMEDIMAQLEEN